MATERQKKVLEKVGRGLSVSKAMREAGYSETYSKNPQRVRETKTFQEIFSKTITDELITKATKQLVNYRQPVTYEFPASLTEKEVHDVMRKHGFKKNQYFHKLVKEIRIIKGSAVEMEHWMVYGSKPSGLVIPKGVDIAMKGKGYYAPDKIAFTDTEGKNLVPTELDKELEELESKLRVNYIKEVKNGSGDDKGADRSKDSGDKEAKA
jgi:hypothetical protein